jgi:hypothetical protein
VLNRDASHNLGADSFAQKTPKGIPERKKHDLGIGKDNYSGTKGAA